MSEESLFKFWAELGPSVERENPDNFPGSWRLTTLQAVVQFCTDPGIVERARREIDTRPAEPNYHYTIENWNDRGDRMVNTTPGDGFFATAEEATRQAVALSRRLDETQVVRVERIDRGIVTPGTGYRLGEYWS